jgi:ABC-type transport system involved in multi-copper enzyme maturation permease subunit
MVPLFANRFLVCLPPLWLVGAGTVLAVLVLLVGHSVLRAVAPRLADEARSSVSEGFLGPLAWLAFIVAAVAAAATPAVPVRQIARSLLRIATAAETVRRFEVPAGSKTMEIPLGIRPQELDSISLEGDQPLTVRTQQPIEGFALVKVPDVDLAPGTPWTWRRPSLTAAGGGSGASIVPTNPFLGTQAKLDATNPGDASATLTVRTTLTPEFPQSAILPWTTVAVVAIVAAFLALRLFAGRIAAVAGTTVKEAVAQPVFGVAIILGIVLLLGFTQIPYNTFGDDVKMLKDSGITLVKVLSLLLAVWTASVSVAEEIEGRTAMTVLSKPLTRREFFLGKFAGLVLVVTLVVLILGTALLATTSYKVVYDARESAKTDPLWRDCADEMITVVPGLVLCWLEAIVLSAVSLTVSTRLGLVPNIILSFGVYVLGHLVPLIVQSSVGKFAIVRFFGRLFATILPVLDHFTIEAAVMGGVAVPWIYLAWAAVYAALYSTVVLLVGLILFQHRDLA